MKLLTGCVVSAGLVLSGLSAQAQLLAPQMLGIHGTASSLYQTVSDFEEPYGGAPPAPPPVYGAPPPYGPPAAAPYYGYEPAVMPPHEVYAVLRDNGFLPLGIPHRQGFTYEIAAMDPDGEDGRLVIDGRNGRIMRFMPGYSMGRVHAPDLYGAQAALPPPTSVRGVPRPPAPIPHVASRAVPMPAPKPVERAAPAQPQPQAQAQAQPQVQAHASVAASPVATTTVGETKPPPTIRPTQDMPAVQGLE